MWPPCRHPVSSVSNYAASGAFLLRKKEKKIIKKLLMSRWWRRRQSPGAAHIWPKAAVTCCRKSVWHLICLSVNVFSQNKSSVLFFAFVYIWFLSRMALLIFFLTVCEKKLILCLLLHPIVTWHFHDYTTVWTDILKTPSGTLIPVSEQRLKTMHKLHMQCCNTLTLQHSESDLLWRKTEWSVHWSHP